MQLVRRIAMFCNSIFGYVLSQLKRLFGSPKISSCMSLPKNGILNSMVLEVVTSLKHVAVLYSLFTVEFAISPCIIGRKLFFCTFSLVAQELQQIYAS